MVSDGMPHIDDPRTIRDASFSTSFRGFDQLEVRAFLQTLARQLVDIEDLKAEAEAKVAEAHRELEAAQEIDESVLMARLGEDATAILQTAREQAADRIAQAEQEVADLRARVDAEVNEIRTTAETHAAEMQRELEAKGVELDESIAKEQELREQQRAEVLTQAEHDAEGLRAEARAQGDQTLADARDEGRAMVAEARIVRERILSDLSRRRTDAKVQLEQLRAGRQRLLDAIEVASAAVDEVNRELENSLPEARLAAETAGLTVPAPASAAEVEYEIESARLVGNPFVNAEEVEQAVAGGEFAAAGSSSTDALESDDEAEAQDETSEDTTFEDEELADEEFDPPGVVLSELGDDRNTMFRRKKNLPPVADELPRQVVPTIEPEADFEQVRALDPTLELHPVASDNVGDDVEDDIETEPVDEQHAPIVSLVPDKPAAQLVEEPEELDEPEEVQAAETEEQEEVPEQEEVVEGSDDDDEEEEQEVAAEAAEEEAEEEQQAVDEVEEPEEVEEPDEDDVDALFDRLRADRQDRVAHASAVLAAAEETTESEQPATLEAVPPIDEEPDDSGSSERFQHLEHALAARRSSVAELEKSVGRKLKRRLADEQNELLDLVRRGEISATDVDDGDGADSGAIDGVLGDSDTHAGRYVGAVADQLQRAAEAGAASVGGQAPTLDSEDAQVVVADEWLSSMRLLVQRVLADGEDADDIIDHLRSLYREVKTQRLDSVASSLVVSAYNLGVHAGLSAGRSVRWELAPDSDCGQDCTANVVAGAVTAGTAFPSGHLHPPVIAGCRCLLVADDDLQTKKIS